MRLRGSLRSFEFLFLLFDFPEESCDQVIWGSFDVDGAEVIFPNVKVEKGKSEGRSRSEWKAESRLRSSLCDIRKKVIRSA